MSPPRISLLRRLAAVVLIVPLMSAPAAGTADFSRAERLLLMSDQLRNVTPPTTLSYAFRRSGTLEQAFDDRVGVHLKRRADGQCCVATGNFLSGARHLDLPEIEQAQGNPVTLYFLEHDIREMQRLTRGQANYFRKRIRMALFEAATVRDISIRYRNRPASAQEIVIRPYLDDPNRARFETLARKQYVFVLSDAVPGGVVSIRTTASPEGGGAPLIDEELLLDDAALPPAATLSSTHRP